MIRKLFAGVAVSLGVLTLAAAAHADYPTRSIQAIVPWGAGGATDNVMRSLTPHVEKELGTRVIINNRPGGAAVIGSSYVMNQRPNGYTLLLGAENPQLYPVLGLADFDYSEFYPINVIAQNAVIIAAHTDSPWNNLGDLMADAKARPDSLRMGGAGLGGLPGTVLSMINAVDEINVREVTFAGDGPGITALMGRHIDFMPLSLAASKELLRSGKLKALAVLSSEENPDLPGVAPVTEFLPGIAEYLPWGPFYGVWVHKDTPENVKQKLEQAYTKAVASEAFQQFLRDFGSQSLNISGEEARQFLSRWQSVTAWSMYKAKAFDIAPDTVGIARP